MGHSRIGKLPATRQWKDVIRLIAGGADAAHVAAQTAKAASASLMSAGRDPMLQRVAWLLARIPLAARNVDFSDQLTHLGLTVGPAPTLLEICAAITQHLDQMMLKSGRRSDFAEIAQTALVESLSAIASPAMPGLAGLTSPGDDARIALKGLSTMKQFGVLARDFFSRLIRRCLDYYLSRELPNHVGTSRRFNSLREHRDFEDALDRHCRETSLIVQAYAGDWLSKTAYEEGIDEKNAGKFARYAFTKITSELAIRSSQADNA